MFEPIDLTDARNLFIPLAKASTDYEQCLDKLTSHIASRNDFMKNFFDGYKKRHLMLEEVEELLRIATSSGSRTPQEAEYIRNTFKTVLELFTSEGELVSTYSNVLDTTYRTIGEIITDESVLHKTIITMKLIEDKHELSNIEVKRQELKVMYDRCLGGL